MFSSPAPRATPRRRARESMSVSSRATPSLYSESEAGTGTLKRSNSLRYGGPLTPSVRSARVNALRRREESEVSSAGETIRTARMDLGDGSGLIYARDERLCVSNVGGLPREAQNHFEPGRTVTGHIDPLSGFAVVCSSEGCTAWNYQRHTNSSPTCYSFPAPAPATGVRPSRSPVCVAFCPVSSATDPGLVMVNASGELRYWETTSLALVNIDRCQVAHMDLSGQERVERVSRIEDNIFIITTSASSAFRLGITSHSGRSNLLLSPLTRPGGMFGRASPQIFPRSEDREGIVSIANVDDCTYLLGSGGTLQKWSLSAESHRFVQDLNLADLARTALAEYEWHDEAYRLSILDVQANGPSQLAILVASEEQQSSSSSFHRAQALSIIIFSTDPRSQSLSQISAVPVSYVADHSSSQSQAPRLYIPFGSHLSFLQFKDTIVIVSLSNNEPYENVLSLKDAQRNAFIGVGSKDFPVDPARRPLGPPLVIMPIVGGLMGVEIYDGPVEKQSRMSVSTAALKSKIEQAVFYGHRADNPLSFDLPADFRGNISQAAEAVSEEILESSSPHLPPSFELKAHLMDRLNNHLELIAFIRGNGQMSELSQASRRRLSRDAEKAKAAMELWEHQNRLMEHIHDRPSQSLLADTIAALMEELGVMGEGDLVRTFFRTQVAHLDRLLEIVLIKLRTALPSLSNREDMTAMVLEANRIIILVVRVASTFREDQGAAYEVDMDRPEISLWTAKDSLIDGLDFLYTTTEHLIKDRTRTLGSVIDESSSGDRDSENRPQRQRQALLKDQLTQLAAALCAQMEDRLRRAKRQMSEGADPQEGLALQKRYDLLKPRVIRPLVAFDKIAQAYELAEHHADFATLVWLCHEPASASGPTRIQAYIERLGEEFVFVLYQWYIDQGRLYDLLSQDPVYGNLLTKFFENGDHPELAWMHHVACGRFADAASDLMYVNKSEKVLVQKHLVSSIAKLASVIDIKKNRPSQQSQAVLSGIDQELELVQVQTELREAILSSLPDRRHSKTAIQKYIDDRLASLSERPAFQSLLGRLIERLLEGEALDLEELIDVLTLNNDPSRTGDGALALDRLSRDDSLPESRKQVCLLSIWRRIFIHDDWTTISQTAGRSEESQRRMLRSTLTYHTIKAINTIEEFPSAYILAPYTCTQAPTPKEVSARLTDYPPSDIAALLLDHDSEIQILERYIEQSDLEQRVKEVAELVRRDVQDEADDDDDDDDAMAMEV
ncbi:Non-repetitive/WGA-negative nucleoporin C-terminal-domain-containing protein [Kockovaella imperatae]|uniref:Non-repetitive/WGA-negative nucleoporin C-terminal-domain-containing protein n=1 Tax=Kockovaella imperatae TaxID=4999 RepID=A0A1Y1UBA7_9TREE|nr:Non-repetitive/WGA-negative nucleoporin C-terminal-domain-containing protein [Kockovaella imperatae]ORX35321.1 Non-repetitive/WGA-negative nucleoporin C-terminal-domain-containing protein [Kockovaella imperatae]